MIFCFSDDCSAVSCEPLPGSAGRRPELGAAGIEPALVGATGILLALAACGGMLGGRTDGGGASSGGGIDELIVELIIDAMSMPARSGAGISPTSDGVAAGGGATTN